MNITTKIISVLQPHADDRRADVIDFLARYPDLSNLAKREATKQILKGI